MFAGSSMDVQSSQDRHGCPKFTGSSWMSKVPRIVMDVQSSRDRLWMSKVHGIVYGCPKSPGSSMDVQSSWDRLWVSKVPRIVMDVQSSCPPQTSNRLAELNTENAAKGDWQNETFQKSKRYQQIHINFRKV